MSDELYIGLMTGTSVDAIDIALCTFKDEGPALIDSSNFPLTPELQKSIQALFQPGESEIDLMGQLDVELAAQYAEAVLELLNRNALEHHQIKAIGSHGQTIRHRPTRESGTSAFTLQIGDPNILASRTGIPVVADFRRKDIALGGEGAPLAPGFHQYLARPLAKPIAFLNLGGIANLTVLHQDDDEVIGFDTGPGNALLDYWTKKHKGKPYDDKGSWGARGSISKELLERLVKHPFFHRPPPKSTGKEEFTPQWLEEELLNLETNTLQAFDVQATLVELTAITIAENIQTYAPLKELYICGGGAHNEFLIYRLAQHLPNLKISSTELLGIHPDWIEACAFAWLAFKRVHHESSNIPSVTGAEHPAILGGVWLP